MLSNDPSARIMKQECQHPLETDTQKIENETKILKLQKHQADLNKIRSNLTEGNDLTAYIKSKDHLAG